MFRPNWTHHQEYTVDIIQNLCNHMITYFAVCVGVVENNREAANWKYQHTEQNT
jgi:hypothetical protein